MPLVEKIRGRISSWTSRYLSYAGRLQLISSVLMSIVNFWASVFRLPSKCLMEIEQMGASFLWTGPDLKTAGAKVAWSEICKPKNEGGLGIRALKEVNLVYSLKLTWRMLTGDSLWEKWIRMYLLKKKSFWEVKAQTQAGSWMWRKLLKLREIAKTFFKMEIGNGRHISFWYDKWYDKGDISVLLGGRGIIEMGIRKDATLAEVALRFRRGRKHHSEVLNELEVSLESVRSLLCNGSDDKGIWRGRKGYKPSFSNS